MLAPYFKQELKRAADEKRPPVRTPIYGVSVDEKGKPVGVAIDEKGQFAVVNLANYQMEA